MGNIEKFDSIAGQYDTPERAFVAKRIAEEIRKHVADGKEKTAIDYGCGTGLVGLELAGDFESVLFIDAASNMVLQVERKISELGIKNASALCCDFEAQGTADFHADYIIVAQTLLHIKDIKPVLSHLYSILNDGGHLFIVDFDKNSNIISEEVHNGFDQSELIKTVIEAGFASADAKTFYHGKKMFMNEDASLFILWATTQRTEGR